MTTSPTTLTAIGQSGYCRPFSQVKTISEQLPMELGPDVINPRSAAFADRLPTQATNPNEIAIEKKLLNTTRIAAPKSRKLRITEQKLAIGSNRYSLAPLHCGLGARIGSRQVRRSTHGGRKRPCLMDTLEVNFDRAFGQAKHLCDLLEARRFSIAMLCSDANSAAAATRRGSMGSRIVNENPNTLDAFWLTLRQTTNLTGSA